MTSPPLNNPGVRFPPPLIFVVGFGLGWIIHQKVLELRFADDARLAGIAEVLGLLAVIGGLDLMAWGFFTFRRAHTSLVPHREASQLVETGPYRFTRNPMYGGLTLIYVGGAAIANSIWPLIMLPAVLMLLFRLVIAREERYLETAFGASYREYRTKVGRWF